MSKITAVYRRAALRHGVVIRSRTRITAADHLVNAAVLEMSNYGYRVLPEQISGMSVSALTDMLSDARAIKGADRDMNPIYPGFPQQVKDLPTLTLLIEQLLHYWTAGAFLPNHPTVIREGLPLEDMARGAQEVRVLDAGSASRFFIAELTSRGVALSDTERDLLSGSVAVSAPDISTVHETLRRSRNGENIQVLLRALLDNNVFPGSELVTLFSADMRNVDQLLRLALTAMGEPVPGHEDAAARAMNNLSNRDAYAIRMRSLSRAARRSLIEALGALTEGFHADRLVLRRSLWRRVMRSVHPYSQIVLTEPALRAVDIIHGNTEYRTLDSSVEDALRGGDAAAAITLLRDNRPGALLNRANELLRVSTTKTTARKLANAIEQTAGTSPLTTLIRAYDGVKGANFDGVRVVREAGRTNRLLAVERKDIPDAHIDTVADAIIRLIDARLSAAPAPQGTVGTEGSLPVPLVRRDMSNTDRVLDRGARLTPVGEGDIVRFFSHWTNRYHYPGYLDLGVAILNEDFQTLAVTTWDTWSHNRPWSTYSGDKQVYPGDSAVEFFDIDLKELRKAHPSGRLAVMSIQSWSGIPLSKADMIAGTMLRSNADEGDVFDARTVTSAFSPTTEAMQALPLALDLDTREMIWLDTSSGSVSRGVSAAQDNAIGPVVRDEMMRPRMTLGELASRWAAAHGAPTDDATPVDRDAVLALLN